MDLDSLLQLLNNRLSVLNNGRAVAFNSGDLDTVNKLDADIFNTQDSINQIRLMQALNTAATANKTTPADIVAEKIELLQNIGTALDNPLEVLKYYDISPYATDPLHEQKIADILGTIGEMNSAGAIDLYINTEAIESPVTGTMIMSAAAEYSVDVRLMMALMELDSRFGTAGVAVRTLNPGNVGNNGVDEKTFDSWDDGVRAVAGWLSRHRIDPTQVVEPVLIAPEEPAVETVEEAVPEIIEEVPAEATTDSSAPDGEPVVPEVPPETTEPEVIPEVIIDTPVVEPDSTIIDTTEVPVSAVQKKIKKRIV